MKKRFLGIDARFVDVLAFPEPPLFPHPERRGVVIGEVYLNRVFLSRRRPELAYYLAHGVLHCFGYRHRKKRDRMDMERRERELVSRFRRSLVAKT